MSLSRQEGSRQERRTVKSEQRTAGQFSPTGSRHPSAEGWPARGFRGQIRTGLGVYPGQVKELRFWSLTGREGPTSHSRWCQLHSELCLGAASSDPILRGSACGTRPLITVHAEPPQAGGFLEPLSKRQPTQHRTRGQLGDPASKSDPHPQCHCVTPGVTEAGARPPGGGGQAAFTSRREAFRENLHGGDV